MQSTQTTQTLFADIGNALLRSGLAEAYIIAGEAFQHAGPFEVGQVLSNFEASSPYSAFEAVARAYQSVPGGPTAMLEDATTFQIECTGVVFEVGVARLGPKTFRFLYSKVDAAALNHDLKARVASLEQMVNRMSVILDTLRADRPAPL